MKFFGSLGIALTEGPGVPAAPYTSKAMAERALRSCLLIRHAIARRRHGELVCVVQPDTERLGAWAARHGLAFTNYASLIQLPAVVNFLDIEMTAANAMLRMSTPLTGYLISPHPLTAAGGELTPLAAIRMPAADALLGVGSDDIRALCN